MRRFKNQVIAIVKKIPLGKVASYGQIAVYAGIPRAARAVGMILNKLPQDTNVPWWRVVNNSGTISIRGSIFSRDDQKSLLESEGIKFIKEFEFEIEKYRWKPANKLEYT